MMSKIRTFLVALLIGLVIGAVLAQIAESQVQKKRDGA
jgi:uncharacterized membrane-anchored protein YhcB (DUF1043 family)